MDVDLDDLRIYSRALPVTELVALYRARDTVSADCWAGAVGAGFNGNLDDIRLYNRLLSAEEVKT
ncbi:hypothetical protein T484DRAFT_1862186, partial [Baffinella frigidus]